MRQNASYALTKRTARPCAGMLPAPFFLSQREIFRFHRRRRVLAPKRPDRSRQNKGSFRFHRGGEPLRRNAPAVPGKKGKLRVHWDGAPLRRNAPAFPAK